MKQNKPHKHCDVIKSAADGKWVQLDFGNGWGPLLPGAYAINFSDWGNAIKARVSIGEVEGKPVFKDDELYDHNGIKKKVVAYIPANGNNPCYEMLEFIPYTRSYVTSCSWNPPKRTFPLNGKELPLPDGDSSNFGIEISGFKTFRHYYKSSADCVEVSEAFDKLLRGEG